ncbi:MAG: glycosyltransferase family 4 protein [Nocardioides sp.]
MRIDYLLLDATAGGGIVRTVFTMSQALAARGHDVRIVSLISERPELSFPAPVSVPIRTLLGEPGIADVWPRGGPTFRAVTRATARRLPSRLVGAYDDQAWRYSALTDAALRRYLRGSDAEVVIGTRSGLNLALAQLPASGLRVAQEHVGLHLAGTEVRAAYRRILPGLDALVALTPVDARRYRGLLGEGVPIHAVPNSVRAAAGPAPGDQRVVIAAGRLARQKGFDLLVEAWRPVAAAHPDWSLHIHGRGPQAAQLQAQVEAAGLTDQVVLHGFTPDLWGRLREASAFVLSSRYEGMPMVVLEAMAAGLPVVSFDCPTGPRQLLRGGRSGILVPPKSVAGLSDALLRVVEEPGLRRRLAEASVERVQQFSVDRIAARWEGLLDGLLADQRDLARVG